MLGALGGLLVVSFVIVRKSKYVMAMSLLFTAIAVAYHFGVPWV